MEFPSTDAVLRKPKEAAVGKAPEVRAADILDRRSLKRLGRAPLTIMTSSELPCGRVAVWSDRCESGRGHLDMPKDKKDHKGGRIGNDTPADDGGERGEKPGLKRKD